MSICAAANDSNKVNVTVSLSARFVSSPAFPITPQRIFSIFAFAEKKDANEKENTREYEAVDAVERVRAPLCECKIFNWLTPFRLRPRRIKSERRE